MSKSLYIAGEPSMTQRFAEALKMWGRRGDGYIESEQAVVTWCVEHLVTVNYPEAYGMKFKHWSLQALPFLPKEFKREVITSIFEQFEIVKGLLNRPGIDTIYVCMDSGREGECIYRLMAQMAGVRDRKQKRVWIDSQTEEEISRGIRETKDETEYDNLSTSAYLRAKEDYLIGTNFSRVLTLRYGPALSDYLGTKFTVLSAGRVMTCVMGMVVRRERKIRGLARTPFCRVIGSLETAGKDGQPVPFETKWKAAEGSRYFGTPYLCKDSGFEDRQQAEELAALLTTEPPLAAAVLSKKKKRETKDPSLLYSLVGFQDDYSRMSKISPDETLKVVQELYKKEMVAYPRTDAKILSAAISKETQKDIGGLKNYAPMAAFAGEVLNMGSYRGIAKTRYINDKQITDRYVTVPTGQELGNLGGLPSLSGKMCQVIYRRFLSILYPPAVYQKYSLGLEHLKEHFFVSFKVLSEPGYLKVADVNLAKKNGVEESFDEAKDEAKNGAGDEKTADGDKHGDREDAQNAISPKVGRTVLLQMLAELKKNDILTLVGLDIKEGKTSPPKHYTSDSMILATENADQLIEDEELRAQIKGSGIGTSTTGAEMLKKLFNIKHLNLNKRTQVITPSLLEEMVYDVVDQSTRQLLNPELTISWEKGLAYAAEGSITSDEHMGRLNCFIAGRAVDVIRTNDQYNMRGYFDAAAAFYKTEEEN